MPRAKKGSPEAKAWAEKMRAARNKVATGEPAPNIEIPKDVVDEHLLEKEAMQRQIDELMSNQKLMLAMMGNQGGINLGRNNQVLGEVDKYLVDPDNYPDPTPRLSLENRLQTIAFNHNYELMYTFSIRPYETKTGVNMREPEFLITLLRVVLDDQGNRVQIVDRNGVLKDKFYIARRMMFHEDPQAALVIARENNLDVDKSDERVFLNEMRYLRVRDWLFDYFWPKAADSQDGIHEESVGGTLLQVFTKSSVEPSAVDFDQIKTKL